MEPVVQTSTNGGISSTTVPHTSDYFTALTGHKISDGTSGNFFSVTISHPATFTLTNPAENINGVRLVGPLTARLAARWMWDVSMAVDHAHSQGVLHRDL